MEQQKEVEVVEEEEKEAAEEEPCQAVMEQQREVVEETKEMEAVAVEEGSLFVNFNRLCLICVTMCQFLARVISIDYA